MHKVLVVLSCLVASPIFAEEQGDLPPAGWIASQNLSDGTKSKLDRFLQVATELKDKAGTPGAAIAIVVDGELIYRGGMGFADFGKREPVKPNTLFAAGSCTKAMTGFVAAQLVSDALLDWDDRATKPLPEFRMADDYLTKHVRLRDMFTHMTGLARHDQLWLRGGVTRDQILEKLPYLEVGHALRERYEYNNMMFTLGGLAVARAGETSWDQLIRDRLFEPLGMTSSLTTYDEFVNAPNRSTGYDPGGTRVLPHRSVDVVGPAGSVTSTIEDMSHWLLMLTNGGRFGGKQIIDADSLNYITAPQATIVASDRVFYGIGWEVKEESERRTFEHGGGIDGQNCYVKVLPRDRFGIVILSNHQSDFDDQLAKYASAIFVHDDLKRDTQAEKRIVARRDQYRAPRPKADTPPESKPVPVRINKKYRCQHRIEKYTGRFRHGAYGEITISDSDDGQYHLTIGDVQGFLRHRGYEYFDVLTNSDEARAFEVGFRSNDDGEVIALTTKFEFGSPDLVFHRVEANERMGPVSISSKPTNVSNSNKPNVMRSNKLDITFKVGDGWPTPWVILPEVSPDKFDVPCKDGRRTRVTFESDVDEKTFVVGPGESVLFDIVLPDGKVAKTKLVGKK